MLAAHREIRETERERENIPSEGQGESLSGVGQSGLGLNCDGLINGHAEIDGVDLRPSVSRNSNRLALIVSVSRNDEI